MADENKGVIYVMTTGLTGVIKLGKAETSNYNQLLSDLEQNGYCGMSTMKKAFAVEVDNYCEVERILYTVLDKSRISDTELFNVEGKSVVDLLKLLSDNILLSVESEINQATIRKDTTDYDKITITDVLEYIKGGRNVPLNVEIVGQLLEKESSDEISEEDSIEDVTEAIEDENSADITDENDIEEDTTEAIEENSDEVAEDNNTEDSSSEDTEDTEEGSAVESKNPNNTVSSANSISSKLIIPDGTYIFNRYLKDEDKLLTAKAKIVKHEWILLKGSVLAKTIKTSDTTSGLEAKLKIRRKLKMDKNGVLLEDYNLGKQTPSFTASIVIGCRPTNGWMYWHTLDDRPVDIYRVSFDENKQ